LRWQQDARDFVRRFAVTASRIAVICHGGWILIRGVRAWPPDNFVAEHGDRRQERRRRLGRRRARRVHGGTFSLISSRKPDDLPALCR
jgi:putative intracellular protease/amidase